MARKLSRIRHLYRFLLLDKRIERDPTLNIVPKQWKVLPKSLAREEVEQSLRRSLGSTSFVLERRQARLRGALRCGIARCSRFFMPEHCGFRKLSALKVEDVKLEMGYVLVRGKGDKERIVPLGRSAQEALTTII